MGRVGRAISHHHPPYLNEHSIKESMELGSGILANGKAGRFSTKGGGCLSLPSGAT